MADVINPTASKTNLTAAVSAIVILIPMVNMAFGTHILLPTNDQQAAIVTLVELAIGAVGQLYIIYRRTYVTDSATTKNKALNKAKNT
jgi:hypothetical protein